MPADPTTITAEPPVSSAAPRTARKRRARWAVAALVALVLIVAGISVAPLVTRSLKPAAAAVASTTVRSDRLVIASSADGQVEPAESAEIYTEVGGTVADVAVEVGDRVKAGQRLFTVDDGDLQDEIRSAKAQLNQADQQVASAKQQVMQAEYQVMQAGNRLDALESRTGTAAAAAGEIDEVEKSVEVAKAGLASARLGLSGAKTSRANAASDYSEKVSDLDKLTITAPRSGVVTAVNVVEGGSVSTASGGSTGSNASTSQAGNQGSGSSAAVVIADTSELMVTVAVNEVDIADIEPGQDATVTLDAVDDLELAAKVAWVSPNAESDGGVSTYDVRLTLSKQDARVKSGMTASADIVTLEVDGALLVPKSSVKVDGAEKYVTIVGSNGGTEKRVVTTGPYDEESIQVLTGVEEGERVTATASSSDERGQGGFMGPGGGLEGGGPRMIRREGAGN